MMNFIKYKCPSPPNVLYMIVKHDAVTTSKCSVQFSCSVVSDSLWPRGLQYTRFPCPSPTPEVGSNSCPSSRWSSNHLILCPPGFSSSLQSFPASGSFLRSQFFASGGCKVLELQLQYQFFFTTLNPGLAHCRLILDQLSHQGSPQSNNRCWLNNEI